MNWTNLKPRYKSWRVDFSVIFYFMWDIIVIYGVSQLITYVWLWSWNWRHLAQNAFYTAINRVRHYWGIKNIIFLSMTSRFLSIQLLTFISALWFSRVIDTEIVITKSVILQKYSEERQTYLSEDLLTSREKQRMEIQLQSLRIIDWKAP